MEAALIKAPFNVSTLSLVRTKCRKPVFSFPFNHKTPNSVFRSLTQSTKSNFKNYTSIYPFAPEPEEETETETKTETIDEEEKFDWYSQWYALMPVCDLDKKAPVGKKVMGLDVVIWWDKNDDSWKVFEDSCPHRLAPLSQGRIDQWGRLQCVYHGWCFGGSGDCKFIPQAPLDGPPVHTFQKACIGVYPSTVQNGIVWFWPNTDPQYKDILTKKTPPYIPELDDPACTYKFYNRDMPMGYEVLMENLMDPSHVPYAHYRIVNVPQQPSLKLDREGGRPHEIKVDKIDQNGFSGMLEKNVECHFLSPCVLHGSLLSSESTNDNVTSGNTKAQLLKKPLQNSILLYICMPVSPGNSRVICVFPRTFDSGIDKLVPRWMQHIIQNLVFDSDLYLLHVEEKRLMEAGISNWQKACFVPTKADANVVAFRKWLTKYAGGQVNWGNKFNESLPPTPPREQLMDRYWSHVVNCSSCNAAYKGLNALELSLQLFSVSFGAIVAATTTQGMMSVAARNSLIVAAILCFMGSKLLSHLVYKTFRYHDYNHASH